MSEVLEKLRRLLVVAGLVAAMFLAAKGMLLFAAWWATPEPCKDTYERAPTSPESKVECPPGARLDIDRVEHPYSNVFDGKGVAVIEFVRCTCLRDGGAE